MLNPELDQQLRDLKGKKVIVSTAKPAYMSDNKPRILAGIPLKHIGILKGGRSQFVLNTKFRYLLLKIPGQKALQEIPVPCVTAIRKYKRIYPLVRS